MDKVDLIHANEHYAFIRHASGREDTVNIKDLSPAPREVIPEPTAAEGNGNEVRHDPEGAVSKRILRLPNERRPPKKLDL